MKRRINLYSESFSLLLSMGRQWIVLLILGLNFSLYGQVKTSVDTTTIRIGEEILYSLEVEADSTELVLFPEGQSFLPLEVIESYKVDTAFGEAKFRLIKKYGLTQFDSGAYTIPSQKIVINDRVYSSDSIRVEVRDVPVDTSKQKMFEIKPAIEVGNPPFDFITLLYWLIPLLVIGALLFYLIRRKKRKDAEEEELPPYEEALVSLKKLDSSNLLKEQKSKAYYSQLTEIVKRYLDREIDDTALESTSDELIARLQLHKDAGNFDFDLQTIKKLDSILKRADLVKFAKMDMAENQAVSDRNTIEEIITETHDAVPEPTEEELLQDELYAEELRKKRQFRRVLYGSVAGLVLLVITTVALASTFGWDYLKDNVIGHPTKELAEGEWYRSEYGIPAVIIETPVILERKEVEMPEAIRESIQASNFFVYGSMLDHFYLVVNTTLYKQAVDVELEKALEGALSAFEQRGAKNMIVKTEQFETNQGIKGMKAFGSFESENPLQQNGVKQNYELLVFGQQGAVQQIIVAYMESDPYAAEMVERIINSIELEVQQNQRTP